MVLRRETFSPKKQKEKPSIEIPEEKSTPKKRLEEFLILLYGPPKIGKSTFCSQLNDPLFIATESGLKFLSVRQIKCRNWLTFQAIVEKLENENEAPCKVLIIDTIDNLYKMCLDYVCEKHNMLHPTDLEWGKGWELLFNEFAHWISRVTSLDFGVIFVGHATEKEVTSHGLKTMRTCPSLPTTPHKAINALVDFILYAGFRTAKKSTGERIEKRVLYTKPSETVEAGDRSNKLPATMDFKVEEFKKYFV